MDILPKIIMFEYTHLGRDLMENAIRELNERGYTTEVFARDLLCIKTVLS